MLTSERYSPSLPFPRVPERSGGKDVARRFSLRPFGHCEEDLAIDFNQEMLPHLVTQLLGCCTRDPQGEPPDPSFFWDLTIGKRIECLLTIATAGGSFDLIVQPRCTNEACLQQMEVELSLAELTGEQDGAGDADRVVVEVAGQRLSARKPTGNDQLRWLTSTYPDEESALQTIVETLLEPDEGAPPAQPHTISDEWITSVSDALEDTDPLVNFTLMVGCPYCGQENQYELNLQELSVRKLRDDQRCLLETVHRLAVHYHWSEQEILTLPPWRRSSYLALLQKEGTR